MGESDEIRMIEQEMSSISDAHGKFQQLHNEANGGHR